MYKALLPRNLNLLMIEVFKTKNDLNPIFLKGIFAEGDGYYSMRNINHLQELKVRMKFTVQRTFQNL